MEILFEAKQTDQALSKARKLVEIAPGMCWGYLGVAEGLTGPGRVTRARTGFAVRP